MKPKICCIVMYKNESQNISHMLESIKNHVTHIVFQDNGSTDGTDAIVDDFIKSNPQIDCTLSFTEWKGFGWNRDAVLQLALSMRDKFDWIMKMDCDEELIVEDSFDWSLIDKKHVAYHVTAEAPGIVYFRAWLWRADLPWRFNHDPAHETIYIDDGVTGENFHREPLPRSFRMVAGARYGESYGVKTKYISDALKLEEKLIREGSMLSDLYHFWYVGKSYEDSYRGDFFPLKEHQNEYARRCIFYYQQFINKRLESGVEIDEMVYYSHCGIGNAYRFMGEYEKAFDSFMAAEKYCPVRNDHLTYLSEMTLYETKEYQKSQYFSRFLVDPSRNLPFPEYHFLINPNMYIDRSDYVRSLHEKATDMFENNMSVETVFTINHATQRKKRIFVVDDFYANPHVVREFALKNDFVADIDWYKGRRTPTRYITDAIKSEFENIMGIKIKNWESHAMNGRLQYCTPEDLLVYHYDSQTWAGMVYLTPDAPFESGTSLYAHKQSKIRHADEPNADACFSGGFYDKSKFELVDTIGNVFNRLVIFDARCFHSAAEYFGTNKENSRLFHLFFFD